MSLGGCEPDSLHHKSPEMVEYSLEPGGASFCPTEHCPHCGGTVKIIAAVEDPVVIAKILARLGLPSTAPPCSGTVI